eukprot:1733889-Rhodomonas_salina.2
MSSTACTRVPRIWELTLNFFAVPGRGSGGRASESVSDSEESQPQARPGPRAGAYSRAMEVTRGWAHATAVPLATVSHAEASAPQAPRPPTQTVTVRTPGPGGPATQSRVIGKLPPGPRPTKVGL